MNRSITSTVLWTFLIGLLGATLFFVKHQVKDLETKLASVTRDIDRGEEDIHVLNAEWSFLNDPVRLRDLAERHLGMKSMGPHQIATLDNLTTVAATALAQAQLHKSLTAQAPHAPVLVAQSAPLPSPPKPAQSHPRVAGGTGLAMISSTVPNGENR